MALDPTLVTGAGIGGVIMATCWGMSKVIPSVIKAVRSNGKNSKKNSSECRPGKAQICIDNGTAITQHEERIELLKTANEDAKKDRRDIVKKLDSGFTSVHTRLDAVLMEKIKK